MNENILTIAEAEEALKRFCQKVKDAKEEKAKVQRELTVALVGGAGVDVLQRRSAELHAVLEVAPSAEAEIKTQLERARQVEKTMRPRLEAFLGKVDEFRKSLDEASVRVKTAWEAITGAIDELGGEELPNSWRVRIKMMMGGEWDAKVSPYLGLVGSKQSHVKGRRNRTYTAVENYRSELEKYCDEWAMPITAILHSKK